jgi:hypothetical protein
MKVKMQREYCGGGPMNSKSEVLEFAKLSAIFLLVGCKNNHREKSMLVEYSQ